MTGTAPDLVAARLTSQMLAGPPAGDAGTVVHRLLAVQAQDGRGARLAVRARSRDLAAADVDRALTEDRSLVVAWLNRGTLHLVTAEDYWWLEPLVASRLAAGNARRLRQLGMSERQADRGVDVVVSALAAEGPLTREQLRRRLDDASVPTAGQALVHVLAAASLQAHVVRGPVVGREQAFIAAADWLGPQPAVLDRAEALHRLAHRYLAGHGPTTADDLAIWAGVTLGDARRGLEAVADDVVAAADGLLRLAGAAPPAPLPTPRLLGPFDPLLHGWRERGPLVGDHGSDVIRSGIFRPVALVDGRVVGTWSLPKGTVTLRPLEPLAEGTVDALAEDALDVLRFLGLPARPLTVQQPTAERRAGGGGR